MYIEKSEWDDTVKIYTWEERKQKQRGRYEEQKREKNVKKQWKFKEKEEDGSENLKTDREGNIT